MNNTLDAQRKTLERLSNRDISVTYDPRKDSFECDIKENIIYCPIMPDTLSGDIGYRLRSGFDHETAHILYTDNIEIPDHFFELTNAIEDGRINRKFANKYKGVKENFEKFNDIMRSSINLSELSIEDKVKSVFYEKSWDSGLNNTDLVERYNLDIDNDKFFDLLDQCKFLKSTADCLELSKNVFDFFDWDTPEEENSDSYDKQKGNQSNSGENDSETNEDAESGSEEEKMVDEVETIDKESCSLNEELEKKVNEEITEIKENSIKSGEIYNPYKRDDKLLNLNSGKTHSIDVSNYASVLRQKLIRDIVDFKKDTRKHKKSGTFDDSKVADVILGESDVFYQDRDQQEINSAFCLMLDFSGSMRTAKKIDKVRNFCYLISKTVFLLDLDLSLSIFGYNSETDIPNISEEMKENTNRQHPFTVHKVKDFNESFPRSRSNIKSIGSNVCDGYTFIGEALEFGIDKLYNRDEQTKNLILMSDGRPTNPLSSGSASKHFEDTVTRIDDSDKVNLVGLDFSHNDFMENYIDDSVSIKSIDNFVEASYNKFVNLLRRDYYE